MDFRTELIPASAHCVVLKAGETSLVPRQEAWGHRGIAPILPSA